MSDPKHTKRCPTCGARVAADVQQCPECGTMLPTKEQAWYKGLTPTEIFLLILGSIMLMIGLVAV